MPAVLIIEMSKSSFSQKPQVHSVAEYVEKIAKLCGIKLSRKYFIIHKYSSIIYSRYTQIPCEAFVNSHSGKVQTNVRKLPLTSG